MQGWQDVKLDLGRHALKGEEGIGERKRGLLDKLFSFV